MEKMLKSDLEICYKLLKKADLPDSIYFKAPQNLICNFRKEFYTIITLNETLDLLFNYEI